MQAYNSYLHLTVQRVNILMKNIMISEQYVLYAEREQIKKQLKEVETIKGNVDRILEIERSYGERMVII